jgi:hypothetical protein
MIQGDSDSFLNGRAGGKNDVGGNYFDNNNLQQPLLDNASQYDKVIEGNESFGCWYKLMRSMGATVSKEKRHIYLSGKTVPSWFPSNKLNN